MDFLSKVGTVSCIWDRYPSSKLIKFNIYKFDEDYRDWLSMVSHEANGGNYNSNTY